VLLTVVEAAQLLGQSPRTVRGRLARGTLKGRKKGGRWVIPRDVLPLPESEHRRLQERAEAIRETVDAALPSRVSGNRKRRSVADEVSFRNALALRRELSASDHPAATAAARRVEQALEALGVALHEWGADARHAALTRARAEVSGAVVTLLLDASWPLEDPIRSWVVTLEHEILPPIAGLFRRTERQRSHR